MVVWEGSRVDVRRSFGAAGVPVFDSLPLAIASLKRFLDDTRAGGASGGQPRPGPAKPSFADLFIGAQYASAPAEIAPSALDQYASVAGQTGDRANVHVSPEAAQAAGHPRRVVSGLHTLTYVTILGDQLGL